MKVSYTNTLEDWTAAQAHELDRWPRFNDAVHAWKWGLAVGMGIVVAWAAASVVHSTAAGVVVGGLVGASFYFSYPGYVRRRYLAGGLAQLNVAESRPFLLSDRTVEVTDGGLRMQSRAGEQLVRWIFVRSVDDAAAHVFVRFKYGLGLAIPRRALTPDEAAALVARIRERLAAS